MKISKQKWENLLRASKYLVDVFPWPEDYPNGCEEQKALSRLIEKIDEIEKQEKKDA